MNEHMSEPPSPAGLSRATALTASPARVLIVAALLRQSHQSASQLCATEGLPPRSSLLTHLHALAHAGFVKAFEGNREVHPPEWRGRRLKYDVDEFAVFTALTLLQHTLTRQGPIPL